MERKIEVLGVKIDNLKSEQAVRMYREYLNNDCLNLIEVVSKDMLIKAGKSEELKGWIEGLDMTILSDKEILEAAQIEDPVRLEEVQYNRLLELFIKEIIREHKSVFFLTETEEQMETFENYMKKYYHNLRVSGKYVVENCWGDEDKIVNEINMQTPDVVMSVLGTPLQEQFINTHKHKLNTKIWLGIGKNVKGVHEQYGRRGWLSKLIVKKVFQKKVSAYNNDKGE